MSLLSVENLYLQFDTDEGRITAVDDVSFELNAGEVLGLVGESGSGKSVTALSILKLLPYQIASHSSKSSIKLKGKEILKMSSGEIRKIRGDSISMIFQEPMTALNPLKNIGRQISETLVQHKACAPHELKNRVRNTMDRVGLSGIDPSRFPHQLSGGQRQRVVIAMAVCLEPSILIADEPTTALDVTTQAKILELLKKFAEQDGISIVLITHDLAIVANIANYLILMKEGILVDQGEPKKVFRDLAHPYTKKLFSASSQKLILKENEISEGKLLEVNSVSVNYKSHNKGIFSKSM